MDMPLVTFLSYLFFAALTLSILRVIAEKAAAYWYEHTQPLAPAAAVQGNSEGAIVVAPSPSASLSLPAPRCEVGPPAEVLKPEERASAAWRQVGTSASVMGLLVLPLVVLVVIGNFYLNSLSLEVVLGDPGPPICILSFWGWEIAVTLHLVFAMLASLGILVLSSITKVFRGHTAVVLASWIGLSALLFAVVNPAYMRGMIIDGPENAILSAALALGMAMFEIVMGIVTIDVMLAALLALWRSVTTPAWALWERHQRRRAIPKPMMVQPRRGNRFLLACAWPLMLLHEGPFKIFSHLDTAVARLFTQLITRRTKKGETNHATEHSTPSTFQPDPHATRNGHVGERVSPAATTTETDLDRRDRQNNDAPGALSGNA